MRVFAALLLCLCVLAPGALFGQGYVEGYFGSSSLDESGVDDERSFGFWGGYAVSNNFAFEAGYGNYGEFSVSSGGVTIAAELTSFNFGIKGLVPLDGGIFLHGKAGMAFWDATATISDGSTTLSATNDGEDIYFGFGANYMFSDTSYATVDYLTTDADGSDVSVVSIGIGMMF